MPYRHQEPLSREVRRARWRQQIDQINKAIFQLESDLKEQQSNPLYIHYANLRLEREYLKLDNLRAQLARLAGG